MNESIKQAQEYCDKAILTLKLVEERHGAPAVDALLSFVNDALDDAGDETIDEDALRVVRAGASVELNEDGTVTFAYDDLRYVPADDAWEHCEG